MAEDLLTDSRSTLDDESVHGGYVFVSLLVDNNYHLQCMMLAGFEIFFYKYIRKSLPAYLYLLN